LPVFFLLLSNHYPLAFASDYNWIIASRVFLMGVTIRHYFNTLHARKGAPHWTWLLTALIFVAIAWLSTQSKPADQDDIALTSAGHSFAMAPEFEQVANVVIGNCSMCHGADPSWDGILWAPKGVMLENPVQIANQAREVYLQAGITHAMPPPSASYMSDEDRALIVQWFKGVSG
jgi:uncharacterized membrane protein